MSEQLNECRADFEAWAEPGGYILARHPDRKEKYYNAYTEDAWQAWKAAWNRCAVPKGWQLVPKEPTHGMLKAAVMNRHGNATYKVVSTLGCMDLENEVKQDYRAMLAAAPKGDADNRVCFVCHGKGEHAPFLALLAGVEQPKLPATVKCRNCGGTGKIGAQRTEADAHE